jgi:uncharacterized membrane protein
MQSSSYVRLAVLVALFTFFIELPVFIGVERFCYNNYDLGIYSQAIRYLSWGDWNPWLSGRQINIFNDHFEPILWVLAPFAKVFRPDRVAVFGEALLILFSLAPLVYLEKRGITVKGSSVFFGALILFARPVVRAIGFPVHPSTWSVLPLSLLAVSVMLDRKKWIFASLTLLFLFREEFPFLGIVLGVVFCSMRRWRFGILILAWSSVWGVFDFVLRPMMVGPTEGYGAGLIRSMLTQPGTILRSYLDPMLLRRLFEYVLPLIPVWI